MKKKKGGGALIHFDTETEITLIDLFHVCLYDGGNNANAHLLHDP